MEDKQVRTSHLSYFEINRTPPEEKRRLERALSLAASQEISYLLLTPFTTIPRISFERVKLGGSAVRQLVVRNPGEKELDVSLEKLPSGDKGFVVDYVRFRLGGKEETTLLIGWTPSKGGAVRDNIIVKFGQFRSQVILNGSCLAPEEKRTSRPARNVKPLGPKNVVKPVKVRPTFPSSKLNQVTKVSIPPNPITQMNVSPPKRAISGDNFSSANTPISFQIKKSPSRRETFVRERPPPEACDVLESTPIVNNKGNGEEANAKLFTVMGPPVQIPADRRQTFSSEAFGVSEDDKENCPVPQARESFYPADLEKRFGNIKRRDTFVKVPTAESWTPQKLDTFAGDRKKWQPLDNPMGNLSHLKQLSGNSDDTVFSEMGRNESVIDCSFDMRKYALSPKQSSKGLLDETDSAHPTKQLPSLVVTRTEEPLNLSLKKLSPEKSSIYQPEVSDISLPEYSLNISEAGADMSLAVNMSEFCPDNRVREIEDDLADLEDKALEDEIDRLAIARAASGCRDEIADSREASLPNHRLSSGTLIKSSPTLESSCLPHVTDGDISLHTSQYDLVETRVETEEIIVTEKEIVREEVVEEVIQLEYEIINNEKRLITERNLGRTVSVQEEEIIIRTPRKNVKHCEAATIGEHFDVSNLIQTKVQVDKGESKLTESELDGMLGMLALSECPKNALPGPSQGIPTASTATNPESKAGLPGLKGSPRISNQNYPPCNNFLQKTLNETSFLPPSPDDPRRCSTGVKSKEKSGDNIEGSTEIKKSLFQDEEEGAAAQPDEEFDIVPLSSGGHQLPVIPDIHTNPVESRLSSDTYIATQEPESLSVIQEVDENSQNQENEPPVKEKVDEEKRVSDTCSAVRETSIEKCPTGVDKEIQDKPSDGLVGGPRTPVRPKRANIKYLSKPIEKLVTEEPLKNQEENVSSGLMFVSLSPGQQEKRKSAGSTTTSKKEVKKSRVSLTSSKPPSRVVAGKNPPLPKSTTSTKGRLSLQKPPSASSKPLVNRKSFSSVGKLNLSKPVKASNVHRPNPFASRNRYYDERWIEKQEKGFCNWLNFILTPQGLEDGTAVSPGSVDITKLWSQCSQDVKIPRAPTREVLSMRAYTAKRELNRLRRTSCRLWQSRNVAEVVGKLEIEIEKLRLIIRKDKQINKDVGMKQSILSLILCYNPLWLRIALETVYGELLPLGGNTDLVGLTRFLVRRLLSCPDILAEFAHPTVPHSYREGHQDALNKFTLKKVLELVYFLDIAKKNRLIQHNPCLFCPDSKIKSSRDVLVTFSRDYLSGEGDIIKHLAYLGYHVDHKQTMLDEFDYAVTNVSTDLRCGLRISRVAELLTGSHVATNLRVPAVSRLQKVHNTEIGLKELRKNYPDIPTNITAKDIVDGHREKTLSLLWSIIFGYQLSTILDTEKLKEEIVHLTRSLKIRAKLGADNATKGMKFIMEQRNRTPPINSERVLDGEKLTLLKEWAQLACAHYNVEVENWTVSWCDGRGLCYLVHHYQPGLLPAESVHQNTTTTSLSCSASLDDSLDFSYGNQGVAKEEFNSLLENEKKNFKLLLNKVNELGGVPVIINPTDMSNTIPDEKLTVTFIGYLAARLLDISREIKAARTIQLAWRKYFAVKKEERMKVFNSAASRIQLAVRRFLKIRRHERFVAAAITIQAAYRGFQTRRRIFRMKEEKRLARMSDAAIVLQTAWRRRVAMIKRKQRHENIVKMQALVRGWSVRQRYLKLRRSTLYIQSLYRSNKQSKSDRIKYLAMRNAASKIQTAWKRYLARVEAEKRETAAVKIQAAYRGHVCRKKYIHLRSCTRTLQRLYRNKMTCRNIREHFVQMKHSSVKIQSWYRMRREARRYQSIRSSVNLIQAKGRGLLTRKEIQRKKVAVLTLQNWFRATLAARRTMNQYKDYRRKVILLQSLVRMYIERKKYQTLRKALITLQARARGLLVRSENEKRTAAAIVIQQRWRARSLGHSVRLQFKQTKESCLKLQSWCRMLQIRRRYRMLRDGATMIQSHFRGHQTRLEVTRKRKAIQTLQDQWRSTLQMRALSAVYGKKRKSALLIQRWYRMVLARGTYQQMRRSAILIQARCRGRRTRTLIKRQNEAASVIQTFWRGTVSTRRIAMEYEEVRFSAVRIQRWFRMTRQRKRYLQTKKAVIYLQSLYRGLKVRQDLEAQKDAATRIQSYWRNYKKTQLLRSHFLQLKSVVLKMQSKVRMKNQQKKFCALKRSVLLIQSHSRRTAATKRHAARLKSVLTLQRAWRNKQLARQERQDFLQLKYSAILVQSHWRMITSRRRFKRQQDSAIIVQKHVRRIIAQRQFRLRLDLLKERRRIEVESAETIQAWFRRSQLLKNDRCVFLHLRKTTIFLQSRVRMKREREEFLRKKTAVLLVESVYAVKQTQKKFLASRSAALTIQRWYRGWSATRRAVEEYRSTKESVVRIQAHVRRYLAGKQYRETMERIIRLQSHARRSIVQNRFNKQRSAAILIQRTFREYQLSKTEREKFLITKQAAICIQTWWRMVSHRQSYLCILETITYIQATVRKYQAQKRFRALKRSSLLIQRTFRAKLDQRRERAKFLLMKQSAVSIQSAWRAYKARKLYGKDVHRLVLVQAQVRGFLARKRLQHMQRNKLEFSSALTIQCWFRQKLAFKQVENAKRTRIERLAATRMQAVVRGYLTRQRLLNQREAAVRIQRHWRLHREGKRDRTGFLAMRSAAINIQKHWRMRRLRRMYLADRKKIITCQSIVRMWKDRRRYRIVLSSAKVIQTCYRAHLARQNQRLEYVNIRKSVLKIQSWIRMVICRQDFLRSKFATTTIQSTVRAFLQRRQYQRLRNAAVVVQRRRRALVQCRTERSEYLARRQAAVTIQSEWRKCVCYFEFRRVKEAAITIQRFYRGYRSREFCRRKKEALLVIQKTLRSYSEMKQRRAEFLSKRKSIIDLQRLCRAYVARQEFRKLKDDAEYREQCREEAARRERERREAASRVISRTLRRVKWRKVILKRRESAIIIQKYWRSYRTRVTLKERWIGLTSQLKEIRERLEEATAKAEPKDRLGFRTASAIDYLFCIRDVAELIFAVKTLDTATRLSEDCCRKLSEGENQPLAQILHLAKRCNRSVPHIEVVTISLDILINISRVESTKEKVAHISNLVGDLLQLMMVYRDSAGNIFSKACALLQLLSRNPKIRAQLEKPDIKKKLTEYQTKLSTKQKLKEESQKRRSFNPGSMPPPVAHKKTGLNTTFNASTNLNRTETKKRKGSSSLAAGPPWKIDQRPRFHEDSCTAVSALLRTMELAK